EEIPTESLDIEILLTDNRGTPIGGQPIILECLKENGTTNLLGKTIVFTDTISGVVTYSLPVLLPGKYIIYAYYQPQFDIDPYNDGFLESQAELNFSIVRIPADLSIQKVNLPRIMRGDVLEFTVVSKSETAKEYIIPVRIFVNLDINGDGIAHDDVLDELRYIYEGTGRFSYKIPISPLYQAGIYNFSIEIEEGTFFKGSTWILIDLVERTTLSINYDILNPRAEGKHYIWEPERIRFTLLDEDGTPLPEICGSATDYEIVNRLIRYQIINGRNVYGAEDTSLEKGTFYIIHKPDSYGFETCSAFYEGSRFFTPAEQKRKGEIFRRPLILHFLDYYNDNPERLDLPHSGHRGENITIKARVQDYLNLSYLENHKVFFGHTGKYLDISDISDEDGNVTLIVPLTAENGLIQAGLYNLSIKIYISEKFQSIEIFHSEILRVYENCSVKFMIYKFSTDKYVFKPKILFFDEDNQLLSSISFFIRIINKNTKNIIFSGYANSGNLDISFTEGGKYEIQFTIKDPESAKSKNLFNIASNFLNITNFLAVVETAEVSVNDESVEIWNIFLGFISESIAWALWTGINIGTAPMTFAILFILFLFLGPPHQKVKFTYGMLIKYLFIISVLTIWKGAGNTHCYNLLMAANLWAFNAKLSISLNQQNWIYITLGMLIGVGALIFIYKYVKEVKEDPNRTKNIKDDIENAIKVSLVECIILFLYGLGLTLYDIFKGAGKTAKFLINAYLAMILGIWVAFHVVYVKFERLLKGVGFYL
ncbi:MAG: hypothetical protein ACTSO9_21175, partial [Candidatus Helarchaeota archaeon]